MSTTEISTSEVYLCDKVVFEKGKKYLIKASSGFGKTSVLNFIYGINNNFEGTIGYGGNPLTVDVFDLRKSHLSYVFQDYKLFPSLTVYENIQLKNALTGHKTKTEIEELLSQVSLDDKRDALVNNLSLGQKQRIAIIRALCQPFDFLLLDEPFSHLDKKNADTMSNIIADEIDSQNASLIMTSLDDNSSFNYDKTFNL
jgi:putative ABC transport system ATP-binding protein